MAREIREGQDYEPFACKTVLGWIVSGVTNRVHEVSYIRSCTIAGQTSVVNLTAEVRHFCDIEAFGTEFTTG